MHHASSSNDTVSLIIIGIVFVAAVAYMAWGFLREEQPAGEERRQRRRRRAKRLLDAEHALEKETEKVLPRAVAKIHDEADRKR